MKAGRRKCRIARIWRGDVHRSDSLAEALEEGRQELGAGENRLLIAGGIDHVCGTADVEVPRLKPEELRNALSFELNRVSAIPAEKLSWGYRVLNAKGKGKLHVRLYFMRQTVWDVWVQAVSAMRQGIDALMPPIAVLDPLLDEELVFLQNDDMEGGFVLEPLANSARAVNVTDDPPDAAFGAGQAPLSLPYLDPGPLRELSGDEQRRFAPVVLLGMYALTREFQSDQDTILAVPYELRPKRHRLSRMLAVVLLCYVVAMAVLGGMREYTARKSVMDGLVAERSSIEEQLAKEKAEIRSDTGEFVDRLSQEMAEAYVERPTLPVTLLEVTRLVESEAWCQFFDWNDGNITVQIREETEDEELVKKLEFSPVIGDVIQISKAVAADTTVSRKFEMTARFDLDGEYRPPVRKRESRPPEKNDGAEAEANEEDAGAEETAPLEEGDSVLTREPSTQSEEEETQTEARSADRIVVPPPPPPPPMIVVPADARSNENAAPPGNE